MDRISYLFNKKPFKPQEKVSEWGNKISLEHKQIISRNGSVICEYFMFHSIEKTHSWRYDHDVEWKQDNTRLSGRAVATGCPHCTLGRCFKEEGLFSPPANIISVNLSSDMLPLYVKWAYKISDGEYNNWNGKDYMISSPENMEKLRKIWMSLTKEDHPDQLPPFVECTCSNCKYEWIVF